MLMTRDDAIRFIQNHQPMPLNPSNSLIDQYLSAIDVLKSDHSEESLLLRLRSLGFGLGVYDSVLDGVMSCENHATLIRAIGTALDASNDTNLYWAILAAWEAPDDSYLMALEKALSSKDAGVRSAAVTALEKLGDAGRSVIRAHVSSELDPDVYAEMKEALGE